jgi:hypothetical protein
MTVIRALIGSEKFTGQARGKLARSGDPASGAMEKKCSHMQNSC